MWNKWKIPAIAGYSLACVSTVVSSINYICIVASTGNSSVPHAQPFRYHITQQNGAMSWKAQIAYFKMRLDPLLIVNLGMFPNFDVLKCKALETAWWKCSYWHQHPIQLMHQYRTDKSKPNPPHGNSQSVCQHDHTLSSLPSGGPRGTGLEPWPYSNTTQPNMLNHNWLNECDVLTRLLKRWEKEREKWGGSQAPVVPYLEGGHESFNCAVMEVSAYTVSWQSAALQCAGLHE